MIYDLIVAGGGAAGFYGAVQAASMAEGKKIVILEKSPKLLAKVRISGGGRCNVTHNCFEPKALASHYPRGERALRECFREYQAKDVVAWFSDRGVLLKAEDDGRMFPVTDDSETIIRCLLEEAARYRIRIEVGQPVVKTVPGENGFEVLTQAGESFFGRHLLVATGGSPNAASYSWIRDLGHTIHPPIPSLFTFNDHEKKFQDLMGISVPLAVVRIAGTKFQNQGPLLITHWGLSGPAVIRLSAWAAEYLHAINYEFTTLVSWVGDVTEDNTRAMLVELRKTKAKQKVRGHSILSIPQRLWLRLCDLAEIEDDRIWSELPNRSLNKLLESLIRCPFSIKGKTTFKEEFVTCGGVDLPEIELRTMGSRKVKNLFFAGEVLNIDGETGGFNFQSAWTTAYLAARAINARW